MKIQDSQYYIPRQIFAESYVNGISQVTIQPLDVKIASSSTPFVELLSSLMPNVNLYGDGFVINKDSLADFEQCTDYSVASFAKSTGTFFNDNLCYFHPEYELFVTLNEDLSDEYEVYIFESGFLSVERIYYQSNYPNNAERLKRFFDKYIQKYVSKDAKISLLLKEGNDLVFKSQTIKPYQVDIATMYNDDFMAVHQKIKDGLTTGKKGVVLLHGVAGSGKTNYIKWLTAQVPEKDFIFVPNSMIGMLASPEFMSLLIDRKNSVLVLEDCENYIAERVGGGNTSDVVSTILNIADGILSDVLECQFVCTFNADLTDIDHALLRKGRLIAEYQFEKLTTDKANVYLKSVGDAKTVDSPKTLAELTNIDEAHFVAPTDKKGFGFLS